MKFHELMERIANAQKNGKVVALIDATKEALRVREGRTVVSQRAGVDLAALLVSWPDSIAQGDEIETTLRRSGNVDLIVRIFDNPTEASPKALHGIRMVEIWERVHI